MSHYSGIRNNHPLCHWKRIQPLQNLHFHCKQSGIGAMLIAIGHSMNFTFQKNISMQRG
jgi:hypothetical protein